MWSPDGEWLAFRQQDGLGGEDMMVIRSDGSDPKNLTVGENLPVDGRPYVLDGWITGNVLVHSAKPAGRRRCTSSGSRTACAVDV